MCFPRYMARASSTIITGLLLLLLSTTYLTFNGLAEDEKTYEPGFVEWEVSEHNRLYLSGSDDEALLTRYNADVAPGGFTTFRTAGEIEIFDLQTPPLIEGFNASLNISTYFTVLISSGPSTCTATQSPVTLTSEFYIGSAIVHQATVSEVITRAGEPGAENFSTTPTDAGFVSAKPGDTMRLRLLINNECAATISVEWGGAESRSGGVIIQGMLYEPQFQVRVDDLGIAQIEFTPIMPWGYDDLEKLEFTIWGPVPETDKSIFDTMFLVEQFGSDAPINRTDSNGREAMVWTGKLQLPEGDMVLKVCIKTADSHIDLKCHAQGLIRFEVTDETEPLASAGLWLSLSCMGTVLIFIVNTFRTGVLIPPPLIGALLVMGLLFIPLANDMPDMGGDVRVSEDARIPDFILHQYGNGSVSLDDLMKGKKAVAIGISIPASNNAYDQIKEFRDAQELLGDDVAFVQVVTGDDVRMDDLIPLFEQVNGSWPILIDDSSSRFAKQLPTGVSDAVLIVDPAGHVAFSQHPTASTEEIKNALDTASSGGQQSIASSFALLLGPGLALLFLALPRDEWVPPEEPLPPGALWGSIALSGGISFLFVNLLPLSMVFIPVDMDLRNYVDIGLFIWFTTVVIRAAMSGSVIETRLIAKLLYKFYPENFRQWRDIEDGERDVLIGFYFAWFTYFAFPSMLAQGVGAIILSGGMGWLLGPFMLLIYILMFGLSVLVIRFVASWGGPISRAFGRSGSDVFAKAMGWALVPVALWMMIDKFLEVSQSGLL